MSPIPNGWVIADISFPRVSGDEPLQGTPKKQVNGFSPRERG